MFSQVNENLVGQERIEPVVWIHLAEMWKNDTISLDSMMSYIYGSPG